MTITREQLELAALAAGHEIYGWYEPEGDTAEFADIGAIDCIPWRPHTDPGDAARLADRLLMYVDARGMAVQARVAGGLWHRVERNESANAWCEAVVRCAAAVGERMQLAQRAGATHGQFAGVLAAVDEYDAAKKGGV